MRSVAFWKSAGVASRMLMNFWGLRSVRGNQELWIWIMMRWPWRKGGLRSGRSRLMAGGGVGCRIGKVHRVDVDHFYIEVGVGAGGRTPEMGRDGARDGKVFLKRGGLVDEHVAAAGEEALVGVHVFAGDVGGDGVDEWDGMRGIADVFVV